MQAPHDNHAKIHHPTISPSYLSGQRAPQRICCKKWTSLMAECNDRVLGIDGNVRCENSGGLYCNPFIEGTSESGNLKVGPRFVPKKCTTKLEDQSST